METLFKPGDNCWRVERAQRAAFIVDGEDYFAALRETLVRAQHSIFILGWDLHSRLRLVREGEEDGYPRELGPLLDALAEERPQLEVYILNWDFAMIYALEREFFPRYRLRWKSHDRVHFALDGEHPVGASQHEKMVVVDDAVAFLGGLDLSKWRWDTREHRVDDPRRVDPDGEPYPPFHDVQMVVDGEVARSLAERARERWAAASAEPAPEPLPRGGEVPWPPRIRPCVEQVPLAIARSCPAYDGRDAVREIERLYLDAIAAAERFVYIENQYLSSHAVGSALEQRLQEDDGPEVIVVLPHETGGWLEQHTMDVLRSRLLAKLQDADRHGRLRVYCARLSVDPDVYLMIHAKLMIVDDRLLRIGSSNLSNRSMGLDTECDLALELDPEDRRGGAIAALRRDLLAEHLGASPADVAAAEADGRSLIAAIEALGGGERSLVPLDFSIPEELDQWVPESAVIDPERPVDPEQLLAYVLGAESRGEARRLLLKVLLPVLALILLALLWRWTPLSEWLSAERLAEVAGALRDAPFSPLLVLGAYLIGGFLVVPLTLLIIATVSVYGPWQGAFYALAGAELSALATFGIGHLLGRDTMRRLAGSQLNSVARFLSQRGMLTVITVRLVPVAPFTVVNLIAGVSSVRFRDFAVGSLIGMVPGIFAVAFLADRIVASLRNPSPKTIALLLVAALAAVGLAVGLRRRIQRRRGEQAE